MKHLSIFAAALTMLGSLLIYIADPIKAGRLTQPVNPNQSQANPLAEVTPQIGMAVIHKPGEQTSSYKEVIIGPDDELGLVFVNVGGTLPELKSFLDIISDYFNVLEQEGLRLRYKFGLAPTKLNPNHHGITEASIMDDRSTLLKILLVGDHYTVAGGTLEEKRMQQIHDDAQRAVDTSKEVLKRHEEKISSLKKLKLSNWQRVSRSIYDLPWLEFNFSITNESKVTFKDIIIACDTYAESGTRLSRGNAAIYRLLRPGMKIDLREIKFGLKPEQTEKWGCGVINAEIVETSQ
jgi:hypothetical protein